MSDFKTYTRICVDCGKVLCNVGHVVEPVGLHQHHLHLRRGVDVHDFVSAGHAAARAERGARAAVIQTQIVQRGFRRRGGRAAIGTAGADVVVEFIEIVVVLGVGLCQLLQVIHKSHCNIPPICVVLF